MKGNVGSKVGFAKGNPEKGEGLKGFFDAAAATAEAFSYAIRSFRVAIMSPFRSPSSDIIASTIASLAATTDDASFSDLLSTESSSGFRDLINLASSLASEVAFNFKLSNNLSKKSDTFDVYSPGPGITEDGNQKLAGTMVLIGSSVVVAGVLVARFLKSESKNVDFFPMNMLGSTAGPKGPPNGPPGPNIPGKYSFGALSAFVADILSITCGPETELSSVEKSDSTLLFLRKYGVCMASGDENGENDEENDDVGPNFGPIGPNLGNGPNIPRLDTPLLSIASPLAGGASLLVLYNRFAVSALSKDDPLEPYGTIGLVSVTVVWTGPKPPNKLLSMSVFLEMNIFGSTNFGKNGDFGT